jgi:hypothetical protein
MTHQQLTPLAVTHPAPVLVTAHEVALSTAAAAGSAPTARRWPHTIMVTRVSRVLVALSQPAVHYPRREPSYIEATRMSRAMDRL